MSKNDTYIGSGTYGNVYKKGNDVIKKYNENVERKKLEKIQKMLNTIDPQRKYFGSKIKSIEKKAVVMAYDGVDLDSIIRDKNITSWTDLFYNLRTLLVAADLLYENNIVHGDIKLGNVLFDETKKQLKIIDFDFLAKRDTYQKFQKSNDLFYPSITKETMYFLWPFQRYDFSILEIDSYTMNLLTKLGVLQGNDQNLLEYFIITRKIIGKPQSRWLQLFLQTYSQSSPPKIDYKKIDIYAIGLIFGKFLILYYYPYLMPSFKRPMKRFIIEGLLHPDPLKRYTPKQAMQYWDQIIFDYINEGLYKQFYDSLRKKNFFYRYPSILIENLEKKK